VRATACDVDDESGGGAAGEVSHRARSGGSTARGGPRCARRLARTCLLPLARIPTAVLLTVFGGTIARAGGQTGLAALVR
jgi:hypothetical protein